MYFATYLAHIANHFSYFDQKKNYALIRSRSVILLISDFLVSIDTANAIHPMNNVRDPPICRAIRPQGKYKVRWNPDGSKELRLFS